MRLLKTIILLTATLTAAVACHNRGNTDAGSDETSHSATQAVDMSNVTTYVISDANADERVVEKQDLRLVGSATFDLGDGRIGGVDIGDRALELPFLHAACLSVPFLYACG